MSLQFELPVSTLQDIAVMTPLAGKYREPIAIQHNFTLLCERSDLMPAVALGYIAELRPLAHSIIVEALEGQRKTKNK